MRLRQQIAACKLPRRAGVASMTATIGVVEAVPGDDMRRLLQRARNALQVAIDRGRNQCFALDVNGTMEKEVQPWWDNGLPRRAGGVSRRHCRFPILQVPGRRPGQ